MKQNENDYNDKKSINGNDIPYTRAALLDAIPFDIFNYAEKNDAFKLLVSQVYKEFKAHVNLGEKKSNEKEYRDAVRHILFNAYFGYCVDMPIRYSRRSASYTASGSVS